MEEELQYKMTLFCVCVPEFKRDPATLKEPDLKMMLISESDYCWRVTPPGVSGRFHSVTSCRMSLIYPKMRKISNQTVTEQKSLCFGSVRHVLLDRWNVFSEILHSLWTSHRSQQHEVFSLEDGVRAGVRWRVTGHPHRHGHQAGRLSQQDRLWCEVLGVLDDQRSNPPAAHVQSGYK